MTSLLPTNNKQQLFGYTSQTTQAISRRQINILGKRQQVHQKQSYRDLSIKSQQEQQQVEQDMQDKGAEEQQFNIQGLLISIGAAVIGLTLYTFSSLNSGGSLNDLVQNSDDFDKAISNGRPSVVEFYADWCTICQNSASSNFDLQKKFHDKINYVMLNVDNTRWAPEVSQFKIKGIPQYVFLSEKAKPLAAAVGKIPPSVLEKNVDALANGIPLPFLQFKQKASQIKDQDPLSQRQTNPLDHS